ncbi:hypothetical protein QZH56_30450 [Streptomyces olivoreticuli]|uniref:hypothetical protein n=1 Tax=Streptomyces olivoreticuli TaxID=68246 RepID=UPI002657D4EA|nr:hypothetical protein [Streptomyces olivoreticuli]WKK23026.1 hypothetical protein QZH56_30450 [Streptomyces olivoreticuli]
MERNMFGGSASDVAEDVDGRRVSGAPVTIWDGPSATANRVLDIQDTDGAMLDSGTVVADQHGYLPPFYGPPGVERLWADSGVRRVELIPVNLGVRLKRHTELDPDPHRAREYADGKFAQTVKLTGPNQVAAGAKEPWATIEAPDGSGDMVRMTRSGTLGTNLKSNGCWYLNPFSDSTPLVINTKPLTDSRPAISVTTDGFGTDTAFRVYKNGAVKAAGPIEAGGPVNAPNVGAARIFSGPNPPANPQEGDVWVVYAA